MNCGYSTGSFNSSEITQPAPASRSSMLSSEQLAAITTIRISALPGEVSSSPPRYNRISPSNRELKAQGMENMVSGFIGGIPVTSVIVRTSANINSGARTKMSAILHGIFLLTFVATIPFALNLIPLASLAAILFFIGYKLSSIAVFKTVWDKGARQFLPFITTIAVMLLTDLLMGFLAGMGMSLFFILKDQFNSSHSIKAKSNDSGKRKNGPHQAFRRYDVLE